MEVRMYIVNIKSPNNWLLYICGLFTSLVHKVWKVRAVVDHWITLTLQWTPIAAGLFSQISKKRISICLGGVVPSAKNNSWCSIPESVKLNFRLLYVSTCTDGFKNRYKASVCVHGHSSPFYFNDSQRSTLDLFIVVLSKCYDK